MILLVLVAHDGKTLQLDVSGQTRVDAMQQALVSVTGISVADQIVMCHGARLDPSKPLAAYKLPVADAAAAEDTPVFLYHKLYLRPGAAAPPQETLPVFEVTVPSLPAVGLRHPLQSAHSPLIRALPDYEAQFTQQLGEARAFWEASQHRLHKCQQLMSEQEVQARAADAARANVESHYNYIASIYATFVDKYLAQHQQHAALLAQFGELSAALCAVPLPPQLVTEQWRVLADLQPRVKLSEWHESCSRSHQHFEQKVIELEGVFQLLRGDVERLFLQAPCVDLDALGQQLAEAEGLVEEQASIIQVLTKDLCTVQSLVESVVAQLGSSAGGASLSGAAVHDSCAAVDTLLEQHLHSLLPRVRACDTSVAEFLLRCAEAKACMTRDVLEQLQGIAAQQSRIRDMKHKLALLNEVLSRQAAAFAELQAANRLPAAYRLALAECARRAAWREMYAAQAARLAEHCGRITSKEAAKREAINRQLERHLPHDLLVAAGLLAEPQHCTVSLPPSEAFLLPVTPQDIAKLPAAIQAAADAAAAAPSSERRTSQLGDGAASVTAAGSSARAGRGSSDGSGTPAAGAAAGSSSLVHRVGSLAAPRSGTPSAPSRALQPSMLASTVGWVQRPGSSAAGAADMTASTLTAAVAGGVVGGSSLSDLVVENARLRAELAGWLAQQAAKELVEDVAAAAPAGNLGPTPSALTASSSSTMIPPAAGSPSPSVNLAASAAPSPSSTADQRPYGHGGPPLVPDSVKAELPSVAAALSQAARQQDGAAAAAVAAALQQALALAPVKAALAAKDELIAALESRVAGLTSEVHSYVARITSLEAQLSGQVTAAGAAAAASISSKAQQQHAGPGSSQQQVQHGLVSSPVAGGVSVPSGQQSVVPAFLLEGTQGANFFQPSPAAAATAEGGEGVSAGQAGTDAEQQQQQLDTSHRHMEGHQPEDPASMAAAADVGNAAAAAVLSAAHRDGAPTSTQLPPISLAGGTMAQGLPSSSSSSTDRVHATQEEGGAAPGDVGSPPSVAQDQPSEAAPAASSAGSPSVTSGSDPAAAAAGAIDDPGAAAAADSGVGGGDTSSEAVADSRLNRNLSTAFEHVAGTAAAAAAATDDAAARNFVAAPTDSVAAAAASSSSTTRPAAPGQLDPPVSALTGVTDPPGVAEGPGSNQPGGSSGAAALSVSEPDLRDVLVVRAAAEGPGEEGEAGSLKLHRGSLDSPAATAPGGLTGLLSSSVHYLFNRTGSSKGDSLSPSGATSSPLNSPPPTHPSSP